MQNWSFYFLPNSQQHFFTLKIFSFFTLRAMQKELLKIQFQFFYIFFISSFLHQKFHSPNPILSSFLSTTSKISFRFFCRRQNSTLVASPGRRAKFQKKHYRVIPASYSGSSFFSSRFILKNFLFEKYSEKNLKF